MVVGQSGSAGGSAQSPTLPVAIASIVSETDEPKIVAVLQEAAIGQAAQAVTVASTFGTLSDLAQALIASIKAQADQPDATANQLDPSPAQAASVAFVAGSQALADGNTAGSGMTIATGGAAQAQPGSNQVATFAIVVATDRRGRAGRFGGSRC